MKVDFHEQGWEDYLYWQTQDKKTIKKINDLIKDIKRNGHDGIGRPEPLKHDLAGLWSREIDKKNRLVYRLENDVIEIAECRTHHGDK